MKNGPWDDNRLLMGFSQWYRSRRPAASGELFAVFPAAAIPAPGLTPPKGRETSQPNTCDKEEHLSHFRPPQLAAAVRRPARGRRAQVPCRRHYSTPGI